MADKVAKDKYARNNMYYCEYCNAWMSNHPATIATHEQGIKHKAAVAKKLRDMRKAADEDKAQRDLAQQAIKSIEEKAREQYEKDVQEAAAAAAQNLGKWVYDESAGYYYNEVQRYYYDSKSSMYYGGDPPTWVETPSSIPPEALYGGPPKAKPPSSTAHAPAGGTQAGGQQGYTVVKRVVKVPKHPMNNIGGYQLPTDGVIGGATQLGAVAPAAGSNAGPHKRPRDGAHSNKPLSKEEAEALARREAARRRVEARTKAQFGMS